VVKRAQRLLVKTLQAQKPADRAGHFALLRTPVFMEYLLFPALFFTASRYSKNTYSELASKYIREI